MKELPKAYNPSDAESKTYHTWEKSGFFNPDKLPGKRTKRFVISMPPPNVTGELHLGHAEGTAIQDTLIRYHRMKGEKALWVPGTDHAGIATQVVVERLIAKEGLNRYQLGREEFLKRVWAWKDQYGSRITEQIRQLGASCDWSREAFTMDKELIVAVRTAFKQLYDEGLIYRGKRIINWCPRCASAISDLEVKYVQTNGKLYSIRYQLTGTTKFITVATTRPETMLGDTAIAVHPGDKRYKHVIGKTVTIPIVEREIPIIADSAVEKDFGTGAVKVTPAHDMIDFEIGARHKLPSILVIDESAKITKAGGEFYGMQVLDARRAIISRLEQDGHLDSTVDYVHNVAHCDRCGTVIEPLISEQWFMAMKTLAKPALEVVKNKKIQFIPERFGKTYSHWIEHLHDWTLSRQLWWGHQIPIWYCADHPEHKPISGIETPTACPLCKGKLRQDPDTLDTWFSAGLWTFSTLGWPKKTKDLKTFHPTDVLETSWDIIPFWVSRMIMLSLKLTKQIPFKYVYIHGLVLDKDGKKMSKSKGTGIDPIPMAQKYGTDAIRLSLILNTTPGQDFRLSEEKIANYRNFINKIWNIARFIQGGKKSKQKAAAKSLADKWILSRSSHVTKQVTKHLDAFQLSEAGELLYSFLWHELADWYVEIAKIQGDVTLLRDIFLNCLVLLHPFAPFVTEQLWGMLSGKKTLLMIEPWPKTGKTNSAAEKEFVYLQNMITAIRTIKNISKIPPQQHVAMYLSGPTAKNVIREQAIIQKLGGVSTLVIKPKIQTTIALHSLQIELEIGEEGKQKISQEITRLQGAIERLSGLLKNSAFTAKAPASIISENKQKLAEAQDRLTSLLGKK